MKQYAIELQQLQDLININQSLFALNSELVLIDTLSKMRACLKNRDFNGLLFYKIWARSAFPNAREFSRVMDTYLKLFPYRDNTPKNFK